MLRGPTPGPAAQSSSAFKIFTWKCPLWMTATLPLAPVHGVSHLSCSACPLGSGLLSPSQVKATHIQAGSPADARSPSTREHRLGPERKGACEGTPERSGGSGPHFTGHLTASHLLMLQTHPKRRVREVLQAKGRPRMREQQIWEVRLFSTSVLLRIFDD